MLASWIDQTRLQWPTLYCQGKSQKWEESLLTIHGRSDVVSYLGMGEVVNRGSHVT